MTTPPRRDAGVDACSGMRCVPRVDRDGDGSPEGEDCDDRNRYRYPGLLETRCNGEDEDCDGEDECPYETCDFRAHDCAAGAWCCADVSYEIARCHDDVLTARFCVCRDAVDCPPELPVCDLFVPADPGAGGHCAAASD